ncbi:hypothetical protein UK23_10725 [Lentzea aerocolonigenes]|uniref:Uncharacterized protein n=1 Tax=Lentzea aerocolonigenes TaxID=68170 RepID=A0A0F0H4P8_LENAE|nr:hypothetical protein [Lentzea aerocolonigenes]KJK50455.1 hypothetical protein UK23_10725 [Lentzea aerocolonigenes]
MEVELSKRFTKLWKGQTYVKRVAVVLVFFPCQVTRWAHSVAENLRSRAPLADVTEIELAIRGELTE